MADAAPIGHCAAAKRQQTEAERQNMMMQAAQRRMLPPTLTSSHGTGTSNRAITTYSGPGPLQGAMPLAAGAAYHNLQLQQAPSGTQQPDVLGIQQQLLQCTDPFQRQRLLQLLQTAMVRDNYAPELISSMVAASSRQHATSAGGACRPAPLAGPGPLCCAVHCEQCSAPCCVCS